MQKSVFFTVSALKLKIVEFIKGGFKRKLIGGYKDTRLYEFYAHKLKVSTSINGDYLKCHRESVPHLNFHETHIFRAESYHSDFKTT